MIHFVVSGRYDGKVSWDCAFEVRSDLRALSESRSWLSFGLPSYFVLNVVHGALQVHERIVCPQ